MRRWSQISLLVPFLVLFALSCGGGGGGDAGNGDSSTYYADTDLDGYGDPDVTQVLDAPESGWIFDSTDCNDDDSNIYPGAVETCDDADNDCNTVVDDSCVYCDPVDPEPICGPNQHCYPSTTGATTCVSTSGIGTEGTPCSSDSDCASGFVCLDAGSGNECLEWCYNFGSSITCSNPTSICTDLFGTPLLADTVPYGLCLP